MRSYPEDVRQMQKKFHPYLVQKADGTYDFKPGTPVEIQKLRETCLKRITQYQIEECCW